MCILFFFIRPSRPVRARVEMLATVPQLPYELEKSLENGQTQMIFDFALVDDTIDFVSGICWLFLYRHATTLPILPACTLGTLFLRDFFPFWVIFLSLVLIVDSTHVKIGGEFQPENENVRRPCYRIISSCIFSFFLSFFLVPIKCLKFLFLSLPAHIFSLFF